MELFTKRCPDCQSTKNRIVRTYDTQHNGTRALYQCEACNCHFSETKNTFLEQLRTPLSEIWRVLKARTDGMGLNATVRTFEYAKNTILDWERKFATLHEVLVLYALLHSVIEQIIEGDEAYTKVGKTVPPSESEGWTIALMDRASRFLWELDCGKREESLFQSAIDRLVQVIEHTDDVTLLTDGERRYGNLLFEVCSDVVRTGKRGRPKTTLKSGVKVRVKNKGSQSRKRGRKRPKYQAPWAEHPETSQELEEKSIHANHLEAFFSALRRKCAAYRRRTNTYAKTPTGLRRIARVYWIMHNFLRVHFTTKEVPAVALGVLERRVSFLEICGIQVF